MGGVALQIFRCTDTVRFPVAADTAGITGVAEPVRSSVDRARKDCPARSSSGNRGGGRCSGSRSEWRRWRRTCCSSGGHSVCIGLQTAAALQAVQLLLSPLRRVLTLAEMQLGRQRRPCPRHTLRRQRQCHTWRPGRYCSPLQSEQGGRCAAAWRPTGIQARGRRRR
jgi:hypothetical protein